MKKTIIHYYYLKKLKTVKKNVIIVKPILVMYEGKGSPSLFDDGSIEIIEED